MRLKYSRFWLPKIVNKINIYLFFLGTLVLFIYGIGNLQMFLDSTQMFLLYIFTRIGMIYLVGTFYSIVLIILTGIKGKKMHWGRFILSLGGMVLMSSLFILVNVVITWSRLK